MAWYWWLLIALALIGVIFKGQGRRRVDEKVKGQKRAS